MKNALWLIPILFARLAQADFDFNWEPAGYVRSDDSYRQAALIWELLARPAAVPLIAGCGGGEGSMDTDVYKEITLKRVILDAPMHLCMEKGIPGVWIRSDQGQPLFLFACNYAHYQGAPRAQQRIEAVTVTTSADFKRITRVDYERFHLEIQNPDECTLLKPCPRWIAVSEAKKSCTTP